MIKKDLVNYTGSPLSRLWQLSRFGDMFEELDKLWKTWDLDMKTFGDLQPKSSFPKINVAETEKEYEVEIALAGFSKDDVDLEFKEACLFIKADKKEEVTDEDTDKKYLMKEISSRSFRRALNFPKKVVTDKIECTYKDGVIKCTLPKEVPPESGDDTVKININ